jgi:hypothetical protein
MKDCEGCGAPPERERYSCSYCLRSYVMMEAEREDLRVGPCVDGVNTVYNVNARYGFGWTDPRARLVSDGPENNVNPAAERRYGPSIEARNKLLSSLYREEL